jgi:hypothetical protein
LTCSPSRRVKAHRNGQLKWLRDVAKKYEIHPASLQHVAAMHRLLPKDRVHVIERDMTTFRQRRTKRSFFNDSLDLQKAYDSRIRAAIAAASANAPPS